MNGQLPVVSFRPEGHDKFMGLMMLMVGIQVEVTYVETTKSWPDAREGWEVQTARGEIVVVDDLYIALKPYGLPERYTEDQYKLRHITWERIKMLEVVG